jgi:L-lactate dehydrogenase complex protein LldF
MSNKAESLGWKGWKMGMMKRKMMDMLGGKFKNLLLKNFFQKSWGKHRVLPQVAEKSFSKQWQEKQKGESA